MSDADRHSGSDMDDMSDSSDRPSRKTAPTAASRLQEHQELSGLFDEDEVDDGGFDDVDASRDDEEPRNEQNGGVSDVEMDDAGPSKTERATGFGAEEEEEDDIFGGAADEEEDDRGGYDSRYESQLQEDEGPEYEEVEMQEMEITMPRYLPSHSVPKEINVTRIPNFLNVDYSAFDQDSYLENAANIQDEGEEAAELRQKLRAEVNNTIRWRYKRDEFGNPQIESNARIIRWSDGSYSLKLGSEVFDINRKPIGDTYLAVSHDQQEIVQFHAKVASTMTLVPTSTASLTHMRLSKAIARGNVKVSNIHDIATTEDPEKMKRDAEKAEESKIRARKKLDNKRRQRESRYGYGRDTGDLGGGPGAERGGVRAYDHDDGMGYGAGDQYERDDFVVSDDDEEEERAARLAKVKKQGADKYKEKRRQRKGSEEEEEEEEEEQEEEEEEEEEARFTDEEEERELAEEEDEDDDLEIPKRSKNLKRRRDGDSGE
ncbi:Leo1-like protein-domain-containing protein [Lipomyces tetrasporus]